MALQISHQMIPMLVSMLWKKEKKYYFAFDDGEIFGPPSNISEIEKRILSFVENYRKQNKKLRISKQMRQKMEEFGEAVKKYKK